MQGKETVRHDAGAGALLQPSLVIPSVCRSSIGAPIAEPPPAVNERSTAVLLVDDQPARLLAYETILAGLGLMLVHARSGVQALEQLLRQEFALVLLDVSMPGLDGFETAQLIHQHPRFNSIPLIFVTSAHSSELDRLHGYELGAVDCVHVPIVPQILRSKVSVLVELYRKRAELQALNRLQEIARVRAEAETARTLQALNEQLDARNAELEQANAALSLEIAERERAEAQRELLAGELNHRVKNTLAIIEALASQSARAAVNIACFREAFSERLRALAGVHDLLTRERWAGAWLGEIVRDALERHCRAPSSPRAVEIDGPPVRLAPMQAISLALAFHELGSNAARYGALTCAAGRVCVCWRAHVSGTESGLELIWSERDGPAAPPTRIRRGFGFELIERYVTREVGGRAKVLFAPSGLEYQLWAPFSETVALG